MKADGIGICIGILIGIVIGTIVGSWLEMSGMRDIAIQHKAAHYDQTTGAFTWNQ